MNLKAILDKFNPKHSSVARIYVGLILVTILSKVLGFVREVVVAYKFGVDVDLDVFLVALTIPNMIYSILLYAIPNIVVPRFSNISKDKILFSDYSKSFFWPYFVVLTILQGVYLIMSETLIGLIAGDMHTENLMLAVDLARYFSVFMYFTSLYCAFKGIFHVRKWFMIPAIAPFFVHLFVIPLVYFFADDLGVKAIVFGMGIGAFFQFLVMLVFLNKKKSLIYFRFGIEFTKDLIAPFIVVILIEVIGQAYTLIDRSFAAEIPQGYISGLNYANILNMLPISILGITLSTILFPDFSKLIQSNEMSELRKTFFRALGYVLVIGSASLFVFYFGSGLIVKLLLERGQFDEHATEITAGFLKIASLGIPLIMLHTIISKLFLSLKFEKQLLSFTCVAIAAKFALATWFVNDDWYMGIAMSTVLAFLINDALMLLYLVKRKVFVS